MSIHVKWVGGNQVYYDGATDIMTIKKGTDGVAFNKVDCGASCEANAYTVNGNAGIDESGSGTITTFTITIEKGIITAFSKVS